ncbi:MAG TPA: oxygen-independent coproporphyrinogen III oxidase [Acidiferrobacteraceae bacterium]|nr:oxygen-independent coproporphyrinogen III oxidase [Acidiferrobacteraceae bacterium]HEX20091.1 oxygen-independent coproporphyrinogen III oxidase [Acidiferrobacteraceae bacterium]
MSHEVSFDAALIKRYDTQGPRYTSYPTAAQFSDHFCIEDYRRIIAESEGQRSGRPLSLYVHIPFCDTVCYYCACNKIITNNRAHAETYLQYLYQEMALQAELFDRQRPVPQLHWGGGTPTFINLGQMTELMRQLKDHFSFVAEDEGEFSIEVDPRRIETSLIGELRQLGFNRMSLGVQDVDEAVQQAVNRIQPVSLTRAILQQARKQGFRSISMDLIYGLPLQTPDSFHRTLDVVIDMAPDRLSVFNYAHLPQMFKVQKQIHAEQLPTPEQKLEILQMTIERLVDAGYVYIGMDHFARPDDELAQAQRDGSLTRNFQGYTTRGQCDLLALGVSAISKIDDHYMQNERSLDDYTAALDDGRLPVMRGIVCNEDDKLRSEIIRELICNFRLDITAIESKWAISFAQYFSDELAAFETMAADGLLQISSGRMEVLAPGKLLVRNICMVFDRYLKNDRKASYSRAI